MNRRSLIAIAGVAHACALALSPDQARPIRLLQRSH